MFRYILIGILAVFLASPATESFAADRERIMLRTLPPIVRNHILEQLRGMNIEPNNEMALGITTSDCPSDCNDKVAGGMCLCVPDERGNCPGDSEKVPGEDTCRVKPKTGSVLGGGLSDPVEVVMP